MKPIQENLQKLLDATEIETAACRHLGDIQHIKPGAEGCEECLKTGDRWVHLRVCLTCGRVGCCDDSKNKHANAHHRETGHPMVITAEPYENWIWCYTDKELISEY